VVLVEIAVARTTGWSSAVAVTRGDPARDANARGDGNSGANWTRARAELVYRLAEALKRAVARGDTDVARRIYEEIGRMMPASTGERLRAAERTTR